MGRDSSAVDAGRAGKAGPIVSLELIRGLASLVVFINHLVLFSRRLFPPPWDRLAGFAHFAVLVFFVLSGYVIGLSQQRAHRSPGAFLWARLKRIEPLYLCALSLAVGVFLLFSRETFSPGQVLAYLFFLQSWSGFITGPYPSNGPLWSLGTEMQFYALFALVIWWGKPVAKQVWWGLAILAVVLREMDCRFWGGWGLAEETLGISLVWLLGNFFINQGARYVLPRRQALFVFSLSLMVYRTWWGYDHVYEPLHSLPLGLLTCVLIHAFAQAEIHSDYRPAGIGWSWLLLLAGVITLVSAFTSLTTPGFMAACMMVPWVILPVSFWSGWGWLGSSRFFRQAALTLGRCSYALYVIHFPIIWFSEQLYPESWLQVAWVIAATLWAVVFWSMGCSRGRCG